MFLSLIIYIFILGIIILVHEFGHFICAKKSGVHIYEFSIGMGPVIFTHKGKDNINYNIRALPIGGFVQMAGEVYEDDKKIPKEKFMCNKKTHQRLAILVAGVFNNFVLALVLLFLFGLIWGPKSNIAKIIEVEPGSAASQAGIQKDDVITAINNHHFSSWDVGQIYIYYKNSSNVYSFEVKSSDGSTKKLDLVPKKVTEKGVERPVFGIKIDTSAEKGVIESVKFAFRKFYDVICSMVVTLKGLFTGQISLSNLSGPVGIYSVVDESRKSGLAQLIYITAFLSINVGFINILPFPAFDGGHVAFLIIEKIKGSKINEKFESTVNLVGFALLMLLMIIITFKDIFRLFH